MFLRKYGLPLSVLLIAIVAVGLYILQTQPPKDPILIVKPVEFEKQQPQPRETEAPVGNTSQGGHFHADGTWHGEPHAPTEVPVQRPMDVSETVGAKSEDVYQKFGEILMHELTPKERAKMWEQAYRENMGGASPPPGYLDAAEQEFQRILKSVHEPRIQISTIRGFAPNKEQLGRYLELREQFRDAHARGAHNEVDFFQSEMERLEVEAEGDVPFVTVSWQSETAKSKAKHVLKERTEQAYRDFGLEHLLESGISGLNNINPTVSE